MNTLTLKSPSKLNLYLRVLGKRLDGYHEIETIFERITLFDEISLTIVGEEIKIFSDNRHLPIDNTNLAYKAAELLKVETGISGGVEIRINKRIPIASGLGGGSSNAASVLLGLNKLWELKLGMDKLLEIGNKLGSDVPFFISQYPTAVGRGRGEILSPVHKSKENWYVLVNPNVMISSKHIYEVIDSNQNECLTMADDGIKMFICALETGEVESFEKFLYNSLEDVAIKKYRVILEIKEILKLLGIKGILMTGSGPTIFGLVQGREEAMEFKEALSARDEDWQVFVVKTYM